MSTYSDRLQPGLQNLLQHAVQFFHTRSSCTTHISIDVFSRQKSLVKLVTWQNISSCSVLPPEIIMHDAYIGGHSENNIKCMVEEPNNSIYSAASLALRVIFSVSELWTYLVLSQSHSIGTCTSWEGHVSDNGLILAYGLTALAREIRLISTPPTTEVKIQLLINSNVYAIRGIWKPLGCMYMYGHITLVPFRGSDLDLLPIDISITRKIFAECCSNIF